MSKTLGQRKRVPLIGFGDGFVIAALLVVLVALPAGIKWRSVDRYSQEQANIDAKLDKLPLTDVDWETDAEVPFGTVDLPGNSREITVRPSNRQVDLATPVVRAVLVGGTGQGVGVVGITYPDDLPAGDKLRSVAVVIDRMITELGVDADPFELIRNMDDPTERYGTSAKFIALGDGYFLAPEATNDGTTIRIRTIDDGDTSVYIVSVWPADENDPVSDRMEGSVVIG